MCGELKKQGNECLKHDILIENNCKTNHDLSRKQAPVPATTGKK